MLFYAIVIFTGFILINSCTSDLSEQELDLISSAGSSEIELLKVDSIVLDPGDQMIGRFLEYMKINEEGTTLLFTDQMNQQVFLFDRQGRFINTIGSEGSGPEEFLQIISFDIHNERVVIADESLYVVKIFSVEGELLDSFKLFDGQNFTIPWFGGHLNDRWFYVPVLDLNFTNEKTKSPIVAKIDLSTGRLEKLIGKYDPFVEISNDYSNFHRFAIDEESQQLITSLNTSSRVQIFDLETNTRTNYFSADVPEWRPLQEKITPMMSRQKIRDLTLGTNHVQGIFMNDKLIFQAFQIMTEEWQQTKDILEKQNMLALYDRSGKAFYGTVTLPGLLGEVHNDQLFIIENVNPDQYTIGVYEIELGQNMDHSAVSAGKLQ
jgi:hypothetical protein